MARVGKILIRLAVFGRLPFSQRFIALATKRNFPDKKPRSPLCYELEIPDPSQPIPEEERGPLGPSGHLIPFVPEAHAEREVCGRRIDEVLTYLGTYGMGGAGFFGLRLEQEWLVVAIWGAGEWISIDGMPVEDHVFDDHERPRPWISDGDDNLSPVLIGAEITSLQLNQRSMQMSFSNGMSLAIEETPQNRPNLQRSDRPREFLETDDLRKAVFLAPTSEIWV